MMFWKKNKGVAYGHLADQEIRLFTIKNDNGLSANIINYGATITHLFAPDDKGKMGDILLGYESFEGYTQMGNPFVNCIVGRVANRINNARYISGGETVNVSKNFGDHQLHGGFHGFDKKVWDVTEVEKNAITLRYVSEDGEEGFPGEVECFVQYKLDDDDALHLIYKATSTKVTPVILTNHAYFNLSAGKELDILSHTLQLQADEILDTDHDSIPKGSLLSVRNTPFDLREAKTLKPILNELNGYDHYWILGYKTENPRHISRLSHAPSGRCLDTFTTEPGVQVYTANGWEGSLKYTKGGQPYKSYCGICLETQMYPDSMNHPHFPSPFIGPEDVYGQHTIYKMGVL